MQRILYVLECRHIVPGPPTLVNGELVCMWHNGESFPITDVEVYEWRAKCETCRFARWAGVDKNTAEIFANGHRSRNSGHRIFTEYAMNQEAVKTREKLEAWRVLSES